MSEFISKNLSIYNGNNYMFIFVSIPLITREFQLHGYPRNMVTLFCSQSVFALYGNVFIYENI